MTGWPCEANGRIEPAWGTRPLQADLVAVINTPDLPASNKEWRYDDWVNYTYYLLTEAPQEFVDLT